MEKRGGIREGERNDCRESFLFFSRFDARSEGGKERGDEGERNCFFGKGRRRRRKSCENPSVLYFFLIFFRFSLHIDACSSSFVACFEKIRTRLLVFVISFRVEDEYEYDIL